MPSYPVFDSQANRPLLHSTPVSTNNEAMSRLGWTISYNSLCSSTQASSWCLCSQECGKVLLTLTFGFASTPDGLLVR